MIKPCCSLPPKKVIKNNSYLLISICLILLSIKIFHFYNTVVCPSSSYMEYCPIQKLLNKANYIFKFNQLNCFLTCYSFFCFLPLSLTSYRSVLAITIQSQLGLKRFLKYYFKQKFKKQNSMFRKKQKWL